MAGERPSRRLSSGKSVSPWRNRSAVLTISRRRCSSTGLETKSKAPALRAATAVSMLP
jgi:hypothetical protein